ncbi:hypothetical protein CHS0354_029125 [Potamilus streckersoni]|uniref:G-protein coupled receptors family 1 profile domain-containing protein n=1 Tax=Potamilus streckersoni TaxID=2493646 RepID=A0AAE0SX24_9BIVA|nr:hypothetical protein CHS0354_029125 [Potamilus streckersoni]
MAFEPPKHKKCQKNVDCNIQEENMDSLIPDIQNQTEHLTLVTLKEINDAEAKLLVPVTVFCVIVMVLGLLGNTLVIIIHKLMPTRIFIVCLSALDITTCIVGIPYHVLDLMNTYTYVYPIACKLLTFLMTMPMTASMFILVIVAFDRYLKLCKPLRSQHTNLESIRTCVIAVSCSLVMASPYTLLYGQSTIRTGVGNITGSQCFFDDAFAYTLFPIVYIGFKLLLLVIVTLVLIVVYIIIWRNLIKQEKYFNKLFKSVVVSNKRIDEKSTFFTLSFCIRSREKHHAAVESNDEKSCAMHMKHELNVIGNDIHHSCQKLTNNAPESVQKMDIKSRGKSNIGNEDGNISKENIHFSSVLEGKGYTKNASLRRFQSSSAIGTRSQSYKVNSKPVTHKNHLPRNKLTKIMFTITFVFIITYLPTFCISFLNATIKTFWDGKSNWERILYDVLLRLYLVNNMAKPFIYVVWDSRFRRKCIRLFKRLVCCFASSNDENIL